MPTWTEVAQKNGIPYSIPTTSGDLTRNSPISDLTRNGTYGQTPQLPGSNPNLPTTYSAPGEGTVQKPYNTVDTTATRVPNNQLTGNPTPSNLPGVNNAGSLPPASQGRSNNLNNSLPNVNGTDLQTAKQQRSQSAIDGASSLGNKAVGPISDVLRRANPLGALNDALANREQAARNGQAQLPAVLGGLFNPDGKTGDSLKGIGNDLGNALGKLGDMLGLGPKSQRKGNKVPNIPKNNGNPEYNPQVAGVVYNIRLNGTADDGFPYGYDVQRRAPFSIQKVPVGSGHQFQLFSEGNNTGVFGSTQNNQGTLRIGTISRADGQPLPPPLPEPAPKFDPNGNPILEGTEAPAKNTDPTPNPVNSPSPANAPTAQKSPSPVQSPEGKPKPDAPNAPFNPLSLVPALPLIPSLFPSPTNGQSPSPTTNSNVQSPSLNPVNPTDVNGLPTKQPQFTDNPAQKPDPQPQPKTQTQTPNASPDDPDKCCVQMTGDLEQIKKVLGVDQFPAQLPILTGDENRTITNIPDLLMWNTSNLDAVGGLFPITVKVLQPNGTEKNVKLENMSHAMEELFLMNLTMAEDCDAAVNIGARIATEVVQTKIAVHQGNDLLKAIQRFLGFAVTGIPRLIKLNFSPTAAGSDGKLQNDEMAGFLKPSTQSYVGTDLAEKKEVLPILERMLANTEIVRNAHWHKIKPGKNGESPITGDKLKSRTQKPTKAENIAWEAVKKTMKDLGVEIDDNSVNKGESK